MQDPLRSDLVCLFGIGRHVALPSAEWTSRMGLISNLHFIFARSEKLGQRMQGRESSEERNRDRINDDEGIEPQCKC